MEPVRRASRGIRRFRRWLSCLAAASVGCGGGVGTEVDAGAGQPAEIPFAVEVLDFSPGVMAGFGQERLPDVVLGPPEGQGTENGGRDVLSLGLGGRIELRFGRVIEDRPGPDFLVFENPFACHDAAVFAEPAEVSVSVDGVEWVAFPCTPAPAVGGCVALDDIPAGCAGYGPVFAHPSRGLSATSWAESGGDAFDLADIGVAAIEYIRIVDLGVPGGLQGAPTAGFDLDAVAVIE